MIRRDGRLAHSIRGPLPESPTQFGADIVVHHPLQDRQGHGPVAQHQVVKFLEVKARAELVHRPLAKLQDLDHADLVGRGLPGPDDVAGDLMLGVDAGADGLVLFNRFYQPDFDLDELEVVPRLILSTSQELRLPLRWIAILYGRVSADFALTTGIHTARDVLKATMAGASASMAASTFLKYGIEQVSEILHGVESWMEENEYDSINQMKGSMSQQAVAEPAAFERANYIRELSSFDLRYTP